MSTSTTPAKAENPPAQPTVPDAVDASDAEDTGLVSLSGTDVTGGLVFAADKRALAKIKDETEDTSKHVVLTVLTPFVDTFVATIDDVTYTVNSVGSLFPPEVEQEIITQAATQGVAVSATKAV